MPSYAFGKDRRLLKPSEFQEVFDGKAMIVTMSRRIAAELYEEIIKIRPDWHES